jgi:hypothetical protein
LHPSGIGSGLLKPLCGASSAPARIPALSVRVADDSNAWNGSSLNARRNSIIVGVSFEAKMRLVCA